MAKGIARNWSRRNRDLDAWEIESAAMEGIVLGLDFHRRHGDGGTAAGFVRQNIRWSVGKRVDKLRRIKRRDQRLAPMTPAPPRPDSMIWIDVQSLLSDREWSDVRARLIEGRELAEIGPTRQAAAKRYH